MSNERDTSRTPTPDHAEHNAFFPSPYSLSQYTSAKTDFDGADYPTPYKGGKKVLMIGTDERYILMQNGSMFSTRLPGPAARRQKTPRPPGRCGRTPAPACH